MEKESVAQQEFKKFFFERFGYFSPNIKKMYGIEDCETVQDAWETLMTKNRLRSS